MKKKERKKNIKVKDWKKKVTLHVAEVLNLVVIVFVVVEH